MTGQSLARSRVAQAALLSGPVQTLAVPDDFQLVPIVRANLARLQTVLVPGATIEGVLVELYNLTRKNPDLLRVSGEDLVPALCDALETGGKIGVDVYLMPFARNRGSGHDVTVALDYKFKVELIVRAGGARSIDAFPVFANEPFQMELGSSPFVRHQPLPASKRGSQIGAYAVAQLGHGVVKVFWCDFEYIETLRARSRSWSDKALENKREKPGCPEWYGPKTAVHRLAKLLPKSPKLTRLLGRIDQEEREEFGDAEELTAGTGSTQGTSAALSAEASATSSSFDLGFDIDGKDEERDAVTSEMSIEQASSLEYQKRPLGTLRNSQLQKIRTGALAKIEEEGDGSKYVPLAAACRIILEARERGEAAEPKGEPATGKSPL